MLENINPNNILFLDIETIPQHKDFYSAPSEIQDLWTKKCSTFRKEDGVDNFPSDFYNRAGIYAEFGKIICISCGFFNRENKFRIKSFSGHDEKKILSDFAALLQKSFSSPDKLLCAHNGKEFDFPFLCRRYLINGIPLPAILNIAGKKPWEVSHLDTMELWKFGDYKSYTSLTLLANVFEIPTPKDDIDGSMVWQVYWKENNLERIVTYCQKDVLTVAQIFRKFGLKELLTPDEIEFVEYADAEN